MAGTETERDASAPTDPLTVVAEGGGVALHLKPQLKLHSTIKIVLNPIAVVVY